MRAHGHLREVQQHEASSTSSTVLTPACSHRPSCEQKRLSFQPRIPREAPPSYPWGSSTTYGSPLLSPRMVPRWQPVQRQRHPRRKDYLSRSRGCSRRGVGAFLPDVCQAGGPPCLSTLLALTTHWAIIPSALCVWERHGLPLPLILSPVNR